MEYKNTLMSQLLFKEIDRVKKPESRYTSVDTEELYEADFAERRSILYTLNFTMKSWFFGPEKEKKVIKFVDVREWTSMDPPSENYDGQITVQPGMTSEGVATSLLTNTVDYSLIDFDDNWDYVVTRDDGS